MIRHNDRRGFTLAELLIVVAIIGVLASIAIPIFSEQLEKSREATDLANVRSAYTEVVTAEISGGGGGVKQESAGAYYVDVRLRQKQNDWQTALPITLGGVSSSDTEHWRGTPRADGCCKVKVVNSEVFLFWNGNALATVAGNDGYQKEHFWYPTEENSNAPVKYVYRGRKDNMTYKNSVAPVVLNKGDSFSVSTASAMDPSFQGRLHGIFAFHLTERDPETSPQFGSIYKVVMDSGWLDNNDFKEFKPTKVFVDNSSEQYYKVEKKGDRLVFTVTKDDGLTLIVNNNVDAKADTMLNDVIIDRAD